MIKNKKIKVLTISILCILTITIGLSYGYYLLNKVQENNNIAGSKCFNLEFTNEKNAISLDNMYPISDEEGRKLTPYSFTITNICDMLAGYTVNMEMLEGTTLNSKYLDTMVNNEEIKLLTNYESTNTVITGSTESRILAKGTLAYNDSIDYTVRLWMDKDVEDTESMNKLFKSKIVISATPSSWNPKDAGYDTLHDAILANEYQTTPADAIKKIEAKGTPDLSNTAPIIKWVENTDGNGNLTIIKPSLNTINTDETTSALTENDTKLKLYKKIKFNNETAYYNLSEPVIVDPITLNYEEYTRYYFFSEGISYNKDNGKLYSSGGNSSRQIYAIDSASKKMSTTTWNDVEYESITYTLNVTKLNSIELDVISSDMGLYQNADDYGTTYYYRGNVKNNNVYFAGYYWQIVRINGDGSIRLIYNGNVKNATGNAQSINNRTYQLNSKYNDPAYVGYMYGDPDATKFAEVHANTNDSTIKAAVDSWYKTNIADKGYSQYISTAVGFCGDRSLSSNSDGDGVQPDKDTIFGAYGRYLANTAQLTCLEPARDLYTTANSGVGNKALTYPVGLITYDEMVFAGMDNRHLNKLSWIYSTQYTWTMSPSFFSATDGNTARGWVENSAGFIDYWSWVPGWNGARPVINLKADVRISGGIGTANEPYVID